MKYTSSFTLNFSVIFKNLIIASGPVTLKLLLKCDMPFTVKGRSRYVSWLTDKFPCTSKSPSSSNLSSYNLTISSLSTLKMYTSSWFPRSFSMFDKVILDSPDPLLLLPALIHSPSPSPSSSWKISNCWIVVL